MPHRIVFSFVLVWVGILLVGCDAPKARLRFPTRSIERSASEEWFDVSRDGHRDFGITYANGRADELLYDDNQDGQPDRAYRLSEYSNAQVPHVLILLDSIPFQTLKERYDAGDFAFFDAPQKIIGAFPSLTELCYNDVLCAPPRPGIMDQYYDPMLGARQDLVWDRAWGHRESWERRLHYEIGMVDQGYAYLHPRPWFAAELEMAHRVIQQSPENLTIVYLSSASGMVCKYGRAGAEEVLDGARQLCLQLLYERHGAIKISMMADHGHNYVPSKLIDLEPVLKASGFRPVDKITRDNDVVIELNGLVTGASLHTRQAEPVAVALLKEPAVELVMYMQRDRAIVRSTQGSAAIEARNGRLRYVPIDSDVLGLSPLIEKLKLQGIADTDGFVDDAQWLKQTIDHQWPDAPRRIWDALHRQVIYTPTVLLSLRDGDCVGLAKYSKFIDMQSTHGGLNQINSATFVLTMTGRVDKPVHQVDLLRTLAPGYEPRLVR